VNADIREFKEKDQDRVKVRTRDEARVCLEWESAAYFFGVLCCCCCVVVWPERTERSEEARDIRMVRPMEVSMKTMAE